jgi:diguanylate cyclase
MDTSLHYDDYAQAIKYLKLTLPDMHKHRIPVTPENYSVWYEYSSGANSALIKKIDTIKSSNTPFTQTINDHLYDLCVAQRPGGAINQLNANVKTVIDNLLHQIKNENSASQTFSDSLKSLSKEVANIQQLSDIESLITRLLSENHKRNDEANQFKQQISAMSDEVIKLDQRLKKVAQDANTDALTGIYNRRGFNQKLMYYIEKLPCQFSLVMIDIDHFKRLNDTYGHLTGDKVLKFVASLIGKNIKGSDYLARFGGEEFVVILPKTNLQNALCVANNIRCYLASQKLYDSTENKQLGRLTLSMGVASYLKGDTTEKIIDRADKCLYEAKESGRNKAIAQKSAQAQVTIDS